MKDGLKMFIKNSSFLLSILLNFINGLNTAKILAFFPTPSISHQVTFYPITNELIERGHEVIVVTTDPLYPKGITPDNLTEINIHDVSYRLWNKMLIESTPKVYSLITQAYHLGNIYTSLFEEQILIPEVQNILKKDKNYFDLILLEACFTPGLILTHIFNAPLIQVSSLGAFIYNLEEIGAPTHPLLYPTPFRKRIHNLSLWEKIEELHTFAWLTIIRNMNERYLNVILRKYFGANVPTLDELRNNIDMQFVNLNPMWAGNMPVPPGLVYTGAIHVKPPKELPQDLKTYLDSSKNGVIYISFGTNVKTNKTSQSDKQKFMNVLRNTSYDILLKWDQEELLEKTTNIKISKWLPQSDVLSHPNIKLFITQGGLQSTDEAIFAGVPLIGMPMLADQWYNVEKYLHFKIGMKIDVENFTEEDLQTAINTVIEDGSYRKNVEKLRRQMYDQPQRSLERAVWWLEYALRHGGARHLRAPAANMPWTEYYECKLICFVLSFITITIYIITWTIRYICKTTMKLTRKIKLKIA